MNESNITEEDYIDPLLIIKELWRNALIIILSALITGAAVLVVTAFFISPTYEATATFYVNNSSISIGSTSYSISAGELSASSTLVNTYLRILQSRTTLEDVIEKGNFPYNYEELREMLTTVVDSSSATFDATITSKSPTEAERIVNTFTEVLPDRIAEIVDGSSVRIIDYAIIPEHRAGPSYIKALIIGFLAGAVLAAGFIGWRFVINEQNDVTVHSSDELRQLYPKVKVLAMIPDMRLSQKKGYYYSSYYGDKSEEKNRKHKSSSGHNKGKSSKLPICENLSFAAKEAFKRLRTNLIMCFPREDTSCHLIGVTSAQPSDGKSTISLNLAFSLAELGKKTLLIDADMRRASLHEKTGVEKTPGLNELITVKTKDIPSALRHYQSGNSETSFDLLPAGEAANNPAELLNSEHMEKLLEAFSKVYDFIVIDLPPIGAVVDAVSVSQELDGMLVVVRENVCPRNLLSECMQQMSYADVNVLGFVLNGALEGSSKRYQYSNYSYGYYK